MDCCYGYNPLYLGVDSAHKANWQPFWIFVIIYFILVIIINFRYGASPLLAWQRYSLKCVPPD